MPDYRAIARLHRELADAYEANDGDSFEGYTEGTGVNAPVDDDQAPDDPWADEAQSQPQRKQNRDAREAGQRQPPRQGGSSTPTQGTFTDDRGKTWTFGKHGAKLCEHGQPAALVSGVSEKTGKTWKAWACPLGYGATWRDKCSLYDFTR